MAKIAGNFRAAEHDPLAIAANVWRIARVHNSPRFTVLFTSSSRHRFAKMAMCKCASPAVTDTFSAPSRYMGRSSSSILDVIKLMALSQRFPGVSMSEPPKNALETTGMCLNAFPNLRSRFGTSANARFCIISATSDLCTSAACGLLSSQEAFFSSTSRVYDASAPNRGRRACGSPICPFFLNDLIFETIFVLLISKPTSSRHNGEIALEDFTCAIVAFKRCVPRACVADFSVARRTAPRVFATLPRSTPSRFVASSSMSC
mmetsp:Transcript_22109/g.66383  ORF Transcript_22109/g.66383 Transcript_22109/m.66383 type:complete len:261 (-) Transcript_22109:4953-5735(-)